MQTRRKEMRDELDTVAEYAALRPCGFGPENVIIAIITSIKIIACTG